MDSKDKFLIGWRTLFPGADLPNLSFFNSLEDLDKEFLQSQKRVNDLTIELQKEEFLLKTLKTLRDDKTFQNFLNEKSLTPAEELAPHPSGRLLSISDNVFSPTMEVMDTNKDVFGASFSSFGKSTSKTSLNESDTVFTSNKEDINSLRSVKSMSLDESYTSATPTKPKRSSTGPEFPPPPLFARPLPAKPAPKTLPRGFKGTRKVSLDSSSSSSVRSKSIDKNQRFKLTASVDLSKLSMMTTASKQLDESEIHKNSDDNLNLFLVGQDDKNLPEVRKFGSISIDSDDDDDDDHIYTDINEFKKPPLATPDVENDSHKLLKNQHMLYENANMKPKLERINDISDEENPSSKRESSKERKRLGSEDRQALVFSDDLDVTVSSSVGSRSNEEMEAILHCSQESLVDDFDDAMPEQFETPAIVVEPDDYYDDDEHIYANVDDLGIHVKESDNDSESDHDGLADSMSGGLPSPSYREMTSDEIMLLQRRGSDDDTQDEDDSDEGATSLPLKSEINRGTLKSSSTLIRGSGGDRLKKPVRSRNASSPVKQKDDISSPGDTEEEEKNSKASRMRKYLVMNLLDSEKCYYDCLEILVKFMKPLKSSTESSQPILSAADFKSIFHQAEELFTIHEQLLFALEPRIQHWNDGQLIGDLFIMIMHHFNTYSAYIGNYKHAMDTVLKCKHANQQFAAIMEQDIRIPSLKDPLKLHGLLYKPVDRMTQYSLILNDLLKYTPPDHPDHPLIVEVSGALFDLFEQVNVDSSKKKRRQRQLLKEECVVEIVDGERRARHLILFNDVIISAKLKPTKDAFVCKWYAALADINLKPYPSSEANQTVPVSSKHECDKIRASIANMRQEIRKDHMPLQQTISNTSADASPPFMKRRNTPGPRSSSRGVEKLKKRIAEQDGLLQLISPSIPLNLYHKNGKTYTLLVNMESDRQSLFEALRPRLKRIHARNAESIQLSSLELQQAFETVLKLQRLGTRFGSQLPSPFLGPTRPLSMDISKFDNDKESLTGYLFVNINQGKGFTKTSDTYVVLEIDSYGHFFKKAKTKPARGSDPQWDESFEFEIEACNWLRLSCYNKLRLMGDDISGKLGINLTREKLIDGKNRTISLGLDRGQAFLNFSLCFSTSIDGIKKCPSFTTTAVFGAPISVVCKREKCDIPVVVISCIKEIEKRGMDELGIYRLSGIASEIQNLKKLFNEQTQNAVLALAEADIHAVAGVLKLYFRELPQSLFTSKLYHEFVEGLSITDAEDKELYMCDVLCKLPRPNKITALYLFEHLRRVVLLEKENKMGVNNLATVFGPTVLRPPSSTNDKENERSSCNVGSFDIGALDVMSQVGIFRYILGLKENERTILPPDDLELWRRLDTEKAAKLEEKLMESAEEFLI